MARILVYDHLMMVEEFQAAKDLTVGASLYLSGNQISALLTTITTRGFKVC